MIVQFICAVVTRVLFISVSLIGVWRVTEVKNNSLYWCLTILYVPLVVEMILTLKRRKGKDYKWFSPAILFFLISIIPTIWILELHDEIKLDDLKGFLNCTKLDSSAQIREIYNQLQKLTNRSETTQDSQKLLSLVCPNVWILALQQSILILLIVGKWLLPIARGVTRNEMAQLLLIFVGTAADILEFNSETLSNLQHSSKEERLAFVYVILAVWTLSMLQFPFHFSVVNSKDEDLPVTQGHSLMSSCIKYRKDIWNICGTLLLQDGPFFIVRLTVMIYFEVFLQMLVFFTIKNFIVVMLTIYRLWVIFKDN